MDIHKIILLFLHHKENASCYTNNKKMRFVGSNNQAYYDILHSRLSVDFQRKVLLLK